MQVNTLVRRDGPEHGDSKVVVQVGLGAEYGSGHGTSKPDSLESVCTHGTPHDTCIGVAAYCMTCLLGLALPNFAALRVPAELPGGLPVRITAAASTPPFNRIAHAPRSPTCSPTPAYYSCTVIH